MLTADASGGKMQGSFRSGNMVKFTCKAYGHIYEFASNWASITQPVAWNPTRWVVMLKTGLGIMVYYNMHGLLLSMQRRCLAEKMLVTRVPSSRPIPLVNSKSDEEVLYAVDDKANEVVGKEKGRLPRAILNVGDHCS
ncbi:hypothetical protein VNO77_21758 [Canavalia gladiata]|uniref:Uncharacterized protein n=1 Tax=Canavalia gladiata TaxID=3824 RepID=A0AAN9L1K2_CANGL